MLSPETSFRGQGEEENTQFLTKLFRRYSRCEDFSLLPEEHVNAMTKRFKTLFLRSVGRPVLHDRLGLKAWTFCELKKQVRTGQPSCSTEFDLGLNDKSIVSRIFFDLRDNQTSIANELELKRA